MEVARIEMLTSTLSAADMQVHNKTVIDIFGNQ
jgi:hypothetical protein